MYATDASPGGYGLDLETAGVLGEAGAARFARFQLVDYPAGGAVSVSIP